MNIKHHKLVQPNFCFSCSSGICCMCLTLVAQKLTRFGCRASGPGVENTQKWTCYLLYIEVMKHYICWQVTYVLPSSVLAEEILSQCKKEGQMVCKNVTKTAIRSILRLSAFVTERREVDLVHPQLSKLLKSVLYGHKHEFWNGKSPKCGNDRHGQTQPCLIGRLPFIILQCLWSFGWDLCELSSISAPFTDSETNNKTSQTSFSELYPSTPKSSPAARTFETFCFVLRNQLQQNWPQQDKLWICLLHSP